MLDCDPKIKKWRVESSIEWKREEKMNANIIVYFNGDILTNMSECMTFMCKKPPYFSISYTMSFVELESGFCQCIEAETQKQWRK